MFGFATSSDLGLFPMVSELIPNMSGLVGAVRILSTSKSLICNAFIGDTTSNPPLLMSYLPLIAKTKQKAANQPGTFSTKPSHTARSLAHVVELDPVEPRSAGACNRRHPPDVSLH